MSRHFLVDGYNVIQKVPRLASKSLEAGRQSFVSMIEENRPQGSSRNRVTVVFDGQEGITSLLPPSDVWVLFSKGETADDVIRQLVKTFSPKKDVIVVTDDRELQDSCRMRGAEIWEVKKFLKQAHKKGERLKMGMMPTSEHQTEKKIPRVFEDKVNRELRKKWLS